MTKLTKEEYRARLDEIADRMGAYPRRAIEQLLRDVVESIVPETQEAKNRYGDHLLVEGHNTCIDTIHKNVEELLS